MRGVAIGVMVVGMVAGVHGWASAEWTKVSNGIPEAELAVVRVYEKDPALIYAASERQVYRTVDAGATWKKVLGLKGEQNAVRSIWVDAEDRAHVWVATDKGLRRSSDGGESWKKVALGSLKSDQAVTWIEPDAAEAGAVWVGTAKGLYHTRKSGESRKIQSLRDLRIHSLSSLNGILLAASDDGLYVSEDRGDHWTRVRSETAPERPAGSDALAQFSIEELSRAPLYSNAAFFASKGQMYLGSQDGLLRSDRTGRRWEAASQLSLPSKSVTHITASDEKVYLATEKGVFETDGVSRIREISDGLPKKGARMLQYHELSGDLFAATDGGLYRYPKPGFEASLSNATSGPKITAAEWLSRFDDEPTVLQVQEAAIRYAEVHPDKIAQWRRAAAAKAWMPTLSVSADQSEDQNIDLDRGGTNDPDRFIEGPAEESGDWHMGVSWDLGELIWNDDQTSIDTRSKLMAELRDDLLNEVTHLYFERRRLQAEMLMRPAVELPLGIEKELKLQELTAGIDALTGGYLSRYLKEEKHVGYHG